MTSSHSARDLVERITAAVLAREGRRERDEIRFRCVEPAAHANGDADPSARWNATKAVFVCDVCGVKGGAVDLARRLGLVPSPGGRGPERVWTLRDACGAVVAEHVRVDLAGGEKRMWWRRPGGARGLGGLGTCDLPLYRAHELPAPDGSLVVVVEGERACDALVARGIDAVGTVTGASGTPSDKTLRRLVGRDVVLWPDADAVGRDHMRRVAARLAALGGAARWYDPAPGAHDGRDAADCTLSDDELRAALAGAPLWQAESDVGVLLAEVECEPVEWLWAGRLARGKLSILEGRPDEGKTTLALDLAARVSTGRPMPAEPAAGTRPPAGVVIITAEDGLADTVRPRLDAAGADLARILAARSEDEAPSLDAEGLAWLRRACARVDAALVILDPLVALMPSRVDAHRDQDVRRMLRPLRALAEELNVAILAIRHLRKSLATDPRDAGGGSVAIGAAARIVMLAARDPDDAERRVLARVKSNLSAPWRSLRYALVPFADTVRIDWGDESPHDAAALLAAASDAVENGEDRTRLDEAVEVIRAILAGGPVAVADARRQLRAAGVADRTADRARARLGVRARPDGFGGSWRWHPAPSAGERGETDETDEERPKKPGNCQSRHDSQSRHAQQSRHRATLGEHGETGGREPGEADGAAEEGYLE
jgi:hypothetical protein